MGLASLLLALTGVVSGHFAVNFFLARFHAAGKNPSPFGFYVQWGSFAVLYGLGMLSRKKPAFHKRYMLFSALVMMMAGSDRMFEVLGVSGGIEVRHWIPTMFCMAIILHHRLELRRLHEGTAIGTAVYGSEVALLLFGRSITRLWSGS